MKLRDLVSRVVSDPRKLTEYALNPDNPKGADKAVMFRRHLGFTQDNYEVLLEQILSQALEADFGDRICLSSLRTNESWKLCQAVPRHVNLLLKVYTYVNEALSTYE